MMMRDPTFQVSKRKKEVGLCLFKKRKRGIQADDDEYFDVNGDDDYVFVNPNLEVFEGNEAGNSSLNGLANDEGGGGGLGFGGEEIGWNPRNVEDGEKESAEEENPSLDSVVGGNRNVVGGGEEEKVEESSRTALVVLEKKNGGDTPPDDDCCPICFDNFSIACKTNCGHWFCAKCILQFWTYRTVLQKCKCPICTRPISKLTPEASLLTLQEVEVTEVLKNVQRYNRLFQGGVNGVIRKVFEVPHVFKRMFCGLMDPDRFRGNYYMMRSIALLMSCIYNICSLDFIPTGSLGVRRLFDLCAIGLVVILCLVGICNRLMLRRRVRRLAGNEY